MHARMEHSSPIRLHSQTGICVGGEKVRGEVELVFPAIDRDKVRDVTVRLRGSVVVRIRRSSGQNSTHTYSDKDIIVSQDCFLWRREQGVASRDHGSVHLHFEFQLPLNAPPSCQSTRRTIFGGTAQEGTVMYFIEVVGFRSGLFKKNRYIRRPLAVLPADQQGEQIRQEIEWLGVEYPTGVWQFKKTLRRNVIGRAAKVHMQLTLPNVAAFPLFTRIPYELHIVTYTRRMKFNPLKEDPDLELFPRPPSQAAEIECHLRRHVWLRARGVKAENGELVGSLGGLGRNSMVQHVDVVLLPREWVPDERRNGAGRWKQEVTLRSFIVFRCSPTFSSRLMDVTYAVALQLKFPGLGNNLTAVLPIYISSGLSASTDASAAPAHGEQDLDLPPPYWQACEEWGDEDDEAGGFSGA